MMTSISSLRLSRGLSCHVCASASATSRKLRSYYLPSSKTFFSLSILLRPRE
jgi:hypothetical protein